MRIFSYRNKRLLKRTLLIALAVLLGILALIVCRFIYLGRFVTYDNAGAHLDYEQHLTATRAPESAPSDVDFSFDTVLDAALNGNTEFGSVLLPDIPQEVQKHSRKPSIHQ